jgi:hypothetical protein
MTELSGDVTRFFRDEAANQNSGGAIEAGQHGTSSSPRDDPLFGMTQGFLGMTSHPADRYVLACPFSTTSRSATTRI